ncbi:hypothetical protein C0J52_14444 [Blattella germanica]|nr:hypothetical protein C0J52_14444 [Blattella germanica]
MKDEKNDKLTIHSLFHMSWYDYHLLWNSSDFDNIEVMRVSSYSLWKPDFDVYTSTSTWSSLQYFYTVCILYSVGSVVCVPPLQQDTSCSADLTRWPFDSHTCKMVIGSWTYAGEQINISFSNKGIGKYNYDSNREWELLSTSATREVKKFSCCPNETYPSVTFEFVLKRHSGIYASTVIVPAIVLMLMTLLTFWMDPGRSERLFITTLDMFCHFIMLQYIEALLPSNGDKTPLLITFYRDSLILTTLALFCGILGKNLKISSQPIPLWASGISSLILNNRIGQMIIFRDINLKPATEISGTESEGHTKTTILSSTSSWDAFIAIEDSLFFIITLLVYIILIIGFIP